MSGKTRAMAIAGAIWALGSGTAAIAAQETPPLPWDAGILGTAEALRLQSANLDLSTDGPAYQATLELSFRNTQARTVEGVAFLPIAAGAVEQGFVADNNGMLMEGQVRSRDRVIRVYRDITRPRTNTPRQRRGGKDPVILERIDDHWLRATIAPVAANATVTLSISYLGLAECLGDLQALHLPMPTSRGERGDPIAYSLTGSVAGAGDELALSAPGQRLRRLERSEGGHQFQLSAPSSHSGIASLYFAADPTRETVDCTCFRTEGEDGYFLLDFDPSHLLMEPLEAASYLVVLHAPGSGQRIHLSAVGRHLIDFVQGLNGTDRLALLSSDDRNESVELRSATEGWREASIARLKDVSAGHRSTLPEMLEQVAGLAEDSELPLRVLVVSTSSGAADISAAAALDASLARLQALPSGGQRDVATFTLALGEDVDRAPLQRLAADGAGRAFHSPDVEHLDAVARTALAALRRPVLHHPQLEIAGATELCADRVRSITFGDRMRVTGRYHAGGTSLVRLRAEGRDGLVDEVYGALLDQQATGSPWVATLWASQRAQQLRDMRQAGGDDADLQYFETRLCERFGLIGPHTVCFGLEPALVARMPRLVAPGEAGGDGPRLADSPFQPLGPRPPRIGGGGLVSGDDGVGERGERSLGDVLRIGGGLVPPTGGVRGAGPGVAAPAAAPRGAPRAAPRGRGGR